MRNIQKNLYRAEVLKEVEERIYLLTNESKPQWGRMNVGQMLAHCAKAFDMARGIENPPRLLIGRMVGPFIKRIYYNNKPIAQNAPTAPTLKMTTRKNFEHERATLLENIRVFHAGGPAQCTKWPHPFFGKLTPDQWSIGMYKHLDHHLQQFGV